MGEAQLGRARAEEHRAAEIPAARAAAPYTAALVLSDGTVIRGQGFGAASAVVGEVCFNTGMAGYQETLSDPSYAGQIITFTFPHIGNVGANLEDVESKSPAVRGMVVREAVTDPSNFRSEFTLDVWMRTHGIPGIAGVDTRRLTRHVRAGGAPTGALAHDPNGKLDIDALKKMAREWPGLEGMDLAKDVSTRESYEWNTARWKLGAGYKQADAAKFRVVAVDYGAKTNILCCLASAGCAVTVVPATATADDILRHSPDGVFLSNGPGDPAATGTYALKPIRAVLDKGIPLFGICLGHQLLGLAVGGKTGKMHQGHRGANHPVKDVTTGKVEITSHNHGFCVDPDTLPIGISATHLSLFDGTLEGLKIDNAPAFSVQYHPEASPGPQDSHYLFDRFVQMMERR